LASLQIKCFKKYGALDEKQWNKQWKERRTPFDLLKGQCHEIFDPPFFRQSITPRPLINTLKYFRILFRIRRAIYENVLIPRYAA
jgi:hypothetical protein